MRKRDFVVLFLHFQPQDYHIHKHEIRYSSLKGPPCPSPAGQGGPKPKKINFPSLGKCFHGTTRHPEKTFPKRGKIFFGWGPPCPAGEGQGGPFNELYFV